MGKKDLRNTARNTVLVYANLPHGQRFRLSGGREVRLEGWPVSRLHDDQGNALPAGQYGVTEVPADDWAQVQKIYGDMAVMRSGVIFAASSPSEGKAMARERAELRHGLEPVDPENMLTKPGDEVR